MPKKVQTETKVGNRRNIEEGEIKGKRGQKGRVEKKEL
jgi:hypothetical protein